MLKASVGIMTRPQKVCIYGVEGVGKTKLAINFDHHHIMDIEGGTYGYMCARITPEQGGWTWAEIINYVEQVRDHGTSWCHTLVIDTIDAALNILQREFCASRKITGIEDIGYGKGWVYIAESLGKLLNRLDECISAGVNVVLISHAQISQFDDPSLLQSYSRYTLKINPKCSALIKEWVDTLIFMNYEVDTVKTENNKVKGQAQRRMCYCEHTPAFDAKNRSGLPPKFEVEDPKEAVKMILGEYGAEIVNLPEVHSAPIPEPKQEEIPFITNDDERIDALPIKVKELADNSGVTAEEIRQAVANRGYFPVDMPVIDYPQDFIEGVLISAWDSVLKLIEENR